MKFIKVRYCKDVYNVEGYLNLEKVSWVRVYEHSIVIRLDNGETIEIDPNKELIDYLENNY